jgi:glutaredoxin
MRILLAIALCAFTIGAAAQVYRWTDAQGRVNITDQPPPVSAKAKDVKKLDAGIATSAPDTAPSTAQEPFALQQAKAKFPVTLYTVPNCEGCNAARTLLNARGVPFKENNLADPAQIEEFKQVVGGNTVPAIIVGTTVQKGFEESTYQKLLDAAGYPTTGVVPPRTQGEPTPTAAAPTGPQVKPAAQPDQPSGPYNPAAAPPEAKPAAQPDQSSGPYAPGATAPPPPTKKK